LSWPGAGRRAAAAVAAPVKAGPALDPTREPRLDPVGGPVLALTQGDPAGVGPEILLKLLARRRARTWRPLLFAERAALAAVRATVPEAPWDNLVFLDAPPPRGEYPVGGIPVVDPVGEPRAVEPGRPEARDAAGALAALDAAVSAVQAGAAEALVTLPVSKATVARHVDPSFRGHTDYLAAACGLERYGRDYLMAFLTPDLQVALLTAHLPLAEALRRIRPEAIGEALACLDRHAGGRIAVAGVNPHAGEGGLLGEEDAANVRPAVATARARGIEAWGPESPDTVFARARRQEFDWVLALYHDQGLIAVKTAGFGRATNWTLGLPFLRTSVDHGTAYAIAGQGIAESEPLARVVETTLSLLDGSVPRKRAC
jgi:4-hydroxythreonine-4-phosphate dehydrogenase